MSMDALRLTPGADERLDKINENLSLLQKIGGLTFTTDAYLLAAFARALPGGTMADLGSGTGVAAFLCLARNKYRHGYAGGAGTGTSGGNTQRAEQTRTMQSAGNKHGAQQ